MTGRHRHRGWWAHRPRHIDHRCFRRAIERLLGGSQEQLRLAQLLERERATLAEIDLLERGAPAFSIQVDHAIATLEAAGTTARHAGNDRFEVGRPTRDTPITRERNALRDTHASRAQEWRREAEHREPGREHDEDERQRKRDDPALNIFHDVRSLREASRVFPAQRF